MGDIHLKQVSCQVEANERSVETQPRSQRSAATVRQQIARQIRVRQGTIAGQRCTQHQAPLAPRVGQLGFRMDMGHQAQQLVAYFAPPSSATASCRAVGSMAT
jgi:hypothetical protein